MLKGHLSASHLAFAPLVFKRQLLQLLQDVVLTAYKTDYYCKKNPPKKQQINGVDVLLIVVLLGSFFLLLPFWLFGGSGSFNLRRQSVNIDPVIFGTKSRFDLKNNKKVNSQQKAWH